MPQQEIDPYVQAATLLKLYMQKHNKSQEEIAKALDVTQATISNFLSCLRTDGKESKRVTSDNLQKIVSLIGYQIEINPKPVKQ